MDKGTMKKKNQNKKVFWSNFIDVVCVDARLLFALRFVFTIVIIKRGWRLASVQTHIFTGVLIIVPKSKMS